MKVKNKLKGFDLKRHLLLGVLLSYSHSQGLIFSRHLVGHWARTAPWGLSAENLALSFETFI